MIKTRFKFINRKTIKVKDNKKDGKGVFPLYITIMPTILLCGESDPPFI